MKLKKSNSLLVLSLITASTASADLFWIPTPLTGNWNTAEINWAATSSGVPSSAWVNLDNAIFDQPGPYTVTITEPALTAGTVTFMGTGTTTVTRTSTAAVTAATVQINSGSTLDLTVGDSLFKTGNTSLVINGTLLNGGTSASRLAIVTGTGTLQGTLRWANGSNFAGNLVDNGATRIGLNMNAFSGGSVTLSGDNSGGTGDYLVASNKLRLASPNAFGANGFLRLEAGTGESFAELAFGDLTLSGIIGVGNGGVNLTSTTTSPAIGAAGFAAVGAPRSITLNGGAGNPIVWGTGTGATQGFNPTTFGLGNSSSTDPITLTNNINLNGAVRGLYSTNGTAAVEGIIPGVISGVGISGIRKSGSGTIELRGANTFAGAVQFNSVSSTATGFLRLSNNDALGPAATVKTIDLNASTGTATGGIELIGGVTISNKNINIGGRTPGERSFLINVSGNNSWGGNLTITNSGGAYFISSLADTLTLTGTISNAVGASTRGLELKGNGDYLITGPVSNAAGTTAITKSGGGTATVSGAKTYTGATTVNGGILTLDTAYLSDASSVVVATGAVLNLTHGATDVVQALTLGGAVQSDGIYNSATPGGFISGTGSIQVQGNPFLVFVSGIANAADRDPGDDPDADGISNGVEFVIGGNPATGGDVALLPTQEFVTADLGAGSTAYLKFTFRRRDVAAYLSPSVEYDTDLTGPWTPATNGVSGVVVQTADDGFATGVDRIDVFIPRSLAVDGRLFARLNVFVTP